MNGVERTGLVSPLLRVYIVRLSMRGKWTLLQSHITPSLPESPTSPGEEHPRFIGRVQPVVASAGASSVG